MKVKIRLFAAPREHVGRDEWTQELPPGSTVQDLADHLFQTWPALREMRLRFAVNAAYAAAETILQDGDQVACIPPVGGG